MKPVDASAGRVFAASLAALEACGRVAHHAGALALELAVRIDSKAENGSSTAALSKELRAAMVEATAKVDVTGDGVDELRSRREARLRDA